MRVCACCVRGACRVVCVFACLCVACCVGSARRAARELLMRFHNLAGKPADALAASAPAIVLDNLETLPAELEGASAPKEAPESLLSPLQTADQKRAAYQQTARNQKQDDTMNLAPLPCHETPPDAATTKTAEKDQDAAKPSEKKTVQIKRKTRAFSSSDAEARRCVLVGRFVD